MPSNDTPARETAIDSVLKELSATGRVGASTGSAAPRISTVTTAGLRTAAFNILRVLLVTATAISFSLLWFFNPHVGRFAFVVLPMLALMTFARAREALIPWSIYIIGFLLFVDLRMVSAELLFPAHFDYVIALEKILFLGHVPSVVLQNALYQLGSPSVLDFTLVTVHFSFFLAPHAVAVLLWSTRPVRFRRYVFALIATCWAGLLIAFLLPTAPPWLAAGEGKIEPVFRIMRDIMMGRTPDNYVLGMRAVGENDVAAMPSLHTALTVLVALAAGNAGRIAGAIGWAYAAAMAIALVYLGEHYVVDIIAGAVVALLIWHLAGRWDAKRTARIGRPGVCALSNAD